MRIISTLRSVLRFKKFEWDPVLRRLESAANVSEFPVITEKYVLVLPFSACNSNGNSLIG